MPPRPAAERGARLTRAARPPAALAAVAVRSRRALRAPRPVAAVSRRRRLLRATLLAALAVMVLAGPAAAQTDPAPAVADPAAAAPAPASIVPPAPPAPPGDPAAPAPPTPAEPTSGAGVAINVDADNSAVSQAVMLVLVVTVASVAPGILLLMTTFTRFVVVLGLTKSALGINTLPPSQVLVGLALFLSFFSMKAVFADINDQAVQPFLNGEIGQSEALAEGYAPLRDFMLDQTRDTDLALFVDLGDDPAEKPEEVGVATLVPAFVISELRTAFTIGFVIFVPFLVIDIVVAAALMSMGMMMLPPVFVSLPLKLLLFVMVDGWGLSTRALVSSVTGAG